MFIDPSAFAQGWSDEATRGRQSRLDNLKLWREFNQQNPYASLSDLQEYRDALTGGSTYLGNVLPSNSVLQNLSERNRRAYEQSQLEQTYANMTKRASLFGTMEASIDDALLQSGGKDFVGAYETFRANNPELEQTPDLLKRIKAAFNPQRYQAAVSAKTIQYLPQAKDLLEASGDDLTADVLQSTFGLPAPIATSLLKKAKTDRDRETLDWTNKNLDLVTSRALLLARNGADATGAVNEALSNMGQPALANSEFAKAVVQAVENKQKTMKEEKARKLDQTTSDAKMKLYNLVKESNATAALVARNNSKGLEDHIWQLSKMLPDYVQEDIGPEAVQKMVKDMVDTSFDMGAVAQGNQIATRNEAYRKDQVELAKRYREANEVKAAAHFGQGKNARAGIANSTNNSKKLLSNAPGAATHLAKIYDMSPLALDALTKTWKQMPEGSSLQELIQTGQEALNQSGAVSLQEAAEAASSVSALRDASHIETQPFNDWFRNKWTAADKHAGIAEDALDAAHSSSKTPEHKIGDLKRLLASHSIKTKRMRAEIAHAKRHSVGPNSWVKIEVGGTSWQENDESSLLSHLDGIDQAISDKAEKLIKDLQGQIPTASSAAKPKGPLVPIGKPTPLSTTTKQTSSAPASNQARDEVEEKLADAILDYQMAAISGVSGSELDKIELDKFIKQRFPQASGRDLSNLLAQAKRLMGADDPGARGRAGERYRIFGGRQVFSPAETVD